jgi:5-methyltetrahydrofolate--homocysteine methyltransferase
MIYKPDWNETKQRFNAWWKGEKLDRPILQICCPRANSAGAKDVFSGTQRMCSDKWTGWNLVNNLGNPAPAIAAFEDACRNTAYLAEAFPNLWINLGAGVQAAYMGCSPRIMPDTVWFEDPKSWEQIWDMTEFNPENKWWNYTLQIADEATAAAKGKFVVGTTDLGGILDIAASMRGAQQLLVDLIECPGNVHELRLSIQSLWKHYHGELEKTLRESMDGSAAWMGLWCQGTWYPIQCDFSAMISPDMFREFALPDIIEHCRYLDHAIYHWDGPGQIPHLDLLLGIEELNGIQWVPGDGQPGCEDPKWFPLYKKILAAGKKLVLAVRPEGIRRLLRKIPSQGLLIAAWCNSENEANELIANTVKWSEKK